MNEDLGILHDTVTHVGPMREVHEILQHEWLMINTGPRPQLTLTEMDEQWQDYRRWRSRRFTATPPTDTA